MRYARGILPLLLGLLFVPEASAQIGLTFRGRRLTTSFYLGSPYGYGGYGLGGWSRPYGYGWGPRYSGLVFVQPQPIIAPPIIINNPAPIINVPAQPAPQPEFVNPIIIRPRQAPADQPPAEAPLPGMPRGGFRPVIPEDRAQAERPAMPRPPAEQRPPRVEQPNADPMVEAARQLASGKQAFAAQQYGRAERLFQQAAMLVPKEAMAFFLLAQAQFALGKYQEAVSSIHAGLRLQPDWPGRAFRPIETYGANVADYTEHLDQLRDAHRRHPKDPVLLFLLAYQLWFDGQKEQARDLFRQAAGLVADPKFIDLFLQHALPGNRVVMR